MYVGLYVCMCVHIFFTSWQFQAIFWSRMPEERRRNSKKMREGDGKGRERERERGRSSKSKKSLLLTSCTLKVHFVSKKSCCKFAHWLAMYMSSKLKPFIFLELELQFSRVVWIHWWVMISCRWISSNLIFVKGANFANDFL